MLNIMKSIAKGKNITKYNLGKGGNEEKKK